MPTILTHAAIPLAIGLAAGRRHVSGRLLALAAAASMLPDADVLGYWLGVPYSEQLGHRGASHSVVAAALAGLLAAMFARRLRCTPLAAFAMVASAMLSHPLLDMATNGGLGVALWWPWSDARLVFPVRPIEVAPLRLERLIGPRGIALLLSELLYVWLPAVAALLAWRMCRRLRY